MSTFRLVPERSTLSMEGTSSIHAITGRGTGVTGTIEATFADGDLDPSVPLEGRIELAVKRLTSGNPVYDAEIRRRVGAGRYPTIAAVVTKALVGDERDRVRVTGDVTFHGTTRSIEGEVTVTTDGSSIRVTGDQVIDIRQFGVKPPRLGLLKVNPEVRVAIDVVGERR